jgi:hypothetical protein
VSPADPAARDRSPRDRVAEAVTRHSGALFAVAAVLSVALLLAIAYQFTFWQDEWSFIERPDLGDPVSWFRPHNEHWSTLPSLAYRATLQVVGLHSYLPFLIELLLVHVVVAAGVFVLVRRRNGPIAGLAAAILVLLLGSGYQNLFWAFQTGFVGSVAAGVWALERFERPGKGAAAAGSILLVVGLACSNIGLVFLAAAAVELVVRGGRRWLAVVPPVAIYVAWYLLVGRSGTSQLQNPFTLGAVKDVGYYLVAGISTAVGGVTGTNRLIGGVVAAIALVATAWIVWRRRAVDPRVAGTLAGLVFLYASIGLARGALATDFTDRSRYVYVAAVLLVLFASAALPLLFGARRWPRAAIVAVTAVVAIAIVGNVAALFRGADVFRAQTGLVRAYVTLVERHEGAPWIDPDERPSGMPEPERLLELTQRFGSPTADAFLPSAAPPPDDEALERALIMLVGDGFRVEPGSPPAGRPVPPTVVDEAGVATDAGECPTLVPTERTSSIEILAPSDSWIEIELPEGGTGEARIGHALQPASRTRRTFEADPGGRVSVHVPSIGDGSDWRVALRLRAPTARVCTWTAK